MKITILCSDKNHPIIKYLNKWVEFKRDTHNIDIVNSKSDLSKGDILFLISCHEILPKKIRDYYKKTLLIHASDLPKGKGWSPHVWEIINGSDQITLSLLKAEDKLDSGEIYKKVHVNIENHELWDEINDKLFKAEISLMEYAVKSFDNLLGEVQIEDQDSSYYSKRIPNDSLIDVNLPIKEQFNKIRVMDPFRYPAFFELNGFKYKLIIDKINNKKDEN
jgi:methionyl-tRNA formyltransferase